MHQVAMVELMTNLVERQGGQPAPNQRDVEARIDAVEGRQAVDLSGRTSA
jgi:hypothetical protein